MAVLAEIPKDGRARSLRKPHLWSRSLTCGPLGCQQRRDENTVYSFHSLLPQQNRDREGAACTEAPVDHIID